MHSCSKSKSRLTLTSLRTACYTYLQDHWQRPKLLGWLLWPFSIMFYLVASLRKFIYQRIAYRAKVPVIVVGNITVGGTGKTPTVIYLAQLLQQHGYKPGIVTRGYKSKVTTVTEITAHSDPTIVGDEAVLLAASTTCPVVIARIRSAGVKYLQDRVDVIICDDGLQHYKLARDIEIAVIDGTNKFGNGFCLPMGPLRELPVRLNSVDLILENGTTLQLEPSATLQGNGTTIHAVAGIGNPARFFNMLRTAGYKVIEHPFPDHHQFVPSDLQFAEQYPILMTAKDAVKCNNFDMDLQTVHVNAVISEHFVNQFLALLKEKQSARSKLT